MTANLGILFPVAFPVCSRLKASSGNTLKPQAHGTYVRVFPLFPVSCEEGVVG